ncbi:MAG: PT domain-containing protein [Brachybacterium sp.]|nr:PT domain-containing protein [Brachybacterium sp.]
MSQPPQNGWGQQPPSGDPYGPSSANGGYGAQGQPPHGFGAPGTGPTSANGGYGQDGAFAPSFGDGGGQGVAPQGGAPKTSYKVPLLVCAGCALLVLLLLVVGGGIFLFTRGGEEPAGGGETTTTEGGEDPTDEPTDEPTEEPPEDPTDEPTEDPSDDPTEEPTDQPAGDGAGTEDDPYALGQKFTLDDGEGGTLDVTIGEVNWDATDEVMDASSSNTAVSENQTYILVPVTVTYHGDDTAEPILLLTLDYHSEAGGTYTDDGALTPQSVIYTDTLNDGDSDTWDYGIIVPAAEIESGHFTVRALFDFSAEDSWVSAA